MWIISIVIICLIFIVLFPLAIQWLIDRDSTHKGSDDGWLGFWGGYLGAIIGVIGALIAIQIPLSYEKKKFKLESASRDKELLEEKKSRKYEQVDNTFFNLLLLFNDQKNTIMKDINPFEELRRNIYESSILELRKMGIDKFNESNQELISILENMINKFDVKFNFRKAQYPQDVQDCLSATRKDYLHQQSYVKKFKISEKKYESIKPEIENLQVIYCIEDDLIKNIKDKNFSENKFTLHENLDKLIKKLQDVSTVNFFDSKSKKI
ncbi:hypothetical protein IV383_13310 [Enterococcus faecalis]|nr:hypothetical protein [Enterococcus faecalis]